MDLITPSDADVLVTLDVTHADVRVGVALDQLGRCLGKKSVLVTRAGYSERIAWAEGFSAPCSVSALRAVAASV
jgi:hypothetical protein